MAALVEVLESRSLLSATTLAPQIALTATQAADLQTIKQDIHAIGQDVSTRAQTLRGDLQEIPATRRLDLATISQDIAQIRADRGDASLFLTDEAQLRTDRGKLGDDVHSLLVQRLADLRAWNLQIATDRTTLARARLKYLSDRIEHL
jgi:hypothetical protein